MATIEILLPKMGESVAEATITKLVVSPSEFVESDEPLVEIATDKVDSEVPAPEDGTLVEWLVAEGDVVAVGQAIARFEIGGEATVAAAAPSAPAAVPTPAVVEGPTRVEAPVPSPAVLSAVSAPLETMPARTGAGGRFYSPLVRSIAKSEGVTTSELEAIVGSGSEGRVTKKDILAYVSTRGTAAVKTSVPAAAAPRSVSASVAPPVVVSGEDEIIEMDRMRKMIADHMVRSVQTSPHVTSFVEADVTRMVQWRSKNKAEFEKAHGTKLTFTPLIAEAIVKAIRDFPGVNATVDGDRIIIKKQINLGMAAALPSGNLIVPVIKNADQFSLVGLAKQVNDLADRARRGKLKPDDTAGGTYTMSNVGTFGNVMGTPIINQPQVAILALGAIRKKPAVLETPDGDVIAVRHMMFLSHSYDHRVVDGMLGGSFVRRVADYLEAFDPERPVV
ncbi:MAG TPA: diapophytoene dehydrogenase [Flavobacteriales bacterium]|nr:diapophytoene dehydrogenase [Flavobacteriales bacterium]